MSKTLKSVAAAALVSFAASPVWAADLSSYENPPAYNEAPASTSWTGAYVGGHIGAAMPSANPFKGGKGLALGAQAGYDYDLGSAVIGGEVEATHLGDAKAKVPNGNLKERWRAAVKAKAGVKLDDTLVYGTAGVTVTSLRDGGGVTGPDGMKEGYLLGAGAEHRFTPQISAKVEYNYVATDDVRTFSNNVVSHTDLSDHVVKGGVNYRF
ncbi:porin family protein [Agrobacterium vaccinii]|jgi:outer membrane immunogenic protein|uniref:outer membrane protein n=1 Tax=Agrobacterium TaxID=357 RepID=UPI000DDBB54A|nr:MULTISPECIES: outer membrane protein [Agrobacterium]UHS59282.1 porin family protein [Agrobacterium vaccinii]UHS63381.1 porin family protein [Agrobacterium vaccinii]